MTTPRILSKRKFEVNYSITDNNTWIAESELVDDIHHVKTTLEISTETKKVIGAKIEFIKSPLADCPVIQNLAKKLLGVKTKDLGFKLFQTFLGKNGCSQVYLLFGLAGPGFENIFDLNEVEDGRNTKDEYNRKMKSDCIAHKLEYKTKSNI